MRETRAYDDNGKLLDPQPDDGARDAAGHYKGCRHHSCEATRCRGLMTGPRGKGWYWR